MLFTVRSHFCRDTALTKSLAELLKAPLLGRPVELFAKVAPAKRYLRRRSQSRIIWQCRLAKKAHGIFKLGAIWSLELERFHHGAPAETGKLRLSLPTRKTKAQQSAYGTRWLMSDLLSKDQPLISLSREFGATSGRAAVQLNNFVVLAHNFLSKSPD
jgi:hypothetical protein